MFEHDKGQRGIAQGLLLCHSNAVKRLGNEAHGGDAHFFKIDRILETPGGATASFSHPGNHRIGLRHQRFEDFLARRTREKRFLRP